MITPSTGEIEPDRPRSFQRVLDERRAVIAADLGGTALPADAHIIFEIGSGHGHFLTAYAQKHPEKVCVGVDTASDRVARAVRKKTRAHLSNLFFFRADAALFLDTLPSETRLAAVFILFPDPWPKARHHKHRVIQPVFLNQLATRMTESASMYFRTDYTPYFQDARAIIERQSRWQIVEEPWPFEYETVFQSRADSFHSLIARPANRP